VKKVVLKTIAITLASIVLALGLFFGSFALFSPITLAKFFDGLGVYSLSINFYESNFNKTKKVSDLATLVVKLDSEKDSERAEKYLKLFTECEGFDAYCDLEDEYTESNISSKEFYLGDYVYVLCVNGKVDEAISVAFDYVEENGYTKNNPCRIIVLNAETFLSQEQMDGLKNKINDCRTNLTDSNQVSYANLDVEWLEQLIG